MSENYVLYVSFVLVGILGYIAGRLDFIGLRLAQPVEAAPGRTTGLLRPRKQAGDQVTPAEIAIDGTTVVTKIDTSGMVRAGQQQLGKSTTTEDDINSAASRLAQLKGK